MCARVVLFCVCVCVCIGLFVCVCVCVFMRAYLGSVGVPGTASMSLPSVMISPINPINPTS